MTDPLLNSAFDEYIDPAEEHATLVQFLGQTYSEISKYDSHLVSVNPFLAPKKQEFEKTAQMVLNETKNKVQQNNTPTYHLPPAPPPHHVLVNQPANPPFVDLGRPPTPPPLNDPNQMEFSFDNSVTAKSINEKLEKIKL